MDVSLALVARRQQKVSRSDHGTQSANNRHFSAKLYKAGVAFPVRSLNAQSFILQRDYSAAAIAVL
jgi:hypothetical protein